jgi:hypothetical protein
MSTMQASQDETVQVRPRPELEIEQKALHPSQRSDELGSLLATRLHGVSLLVQQMVFGRPD